MGTRSTLIGAGLTLLGVGSFLFGAIGGGAALATPQLEVTNPGHATSWHPAKLQAFDSANIRAGGTVTEQFAVENTGKGAMAIDVRFLPTGNTGRYVTLTLRDTTASKTLYDGPITGADVKSYDVGSGDASRRVFEITLTFSASLPGAVSEEAAAPAVSIQSERGK